MACRSLRPDTVDAEMIDKFSLINANAQCLVGNAPRKRSYRVAVSLELHNGQVYKIDQEVEVRDDITAIHPV